MDMLQTLKLALLHDYAFYIYYALLALFVCILAFLAITIPIQLHRISQAPPTLQWAGLKNARFFPKLRAVFREVLAGRGPVNEGYEKFSKHDQPFIIPGMHWNAVVLPPTHASWMAAQPEHIVSGNAVLDESLGLEWLAHGPDAESCRDFTVIRRDLTRQSTRLSAEVYDEIQAAFEDELGQDEADQSESREVSLFKLLQKISFRAANRIFVGCPLCRDKSYAKRVTLWSTTFGICALFMRFTVSTPIKSIFMRVVAIPVKLVSWYATKELRPMIRERLRELQTRGSDKKDIHPEVYNDMMQWIISTNAQNPDPRQLDAANIAGKMILMNIFAANTTATAAATILIDILCYHNSTHLVSLLRDEAAIYLPLVGKDPTALRKMVKMDSVIRETLRFNPLGAQGLIRKVVAAEGVVTPDGLHLPQGTHIHTPVANMQRDTFLFGPTANEYHPLRFCPPESSSSSPSSSNDENKKFLSAVQISPEYLPFGLGKHACPGRFFAVNNIKLILGLLVWKFEVEGFKERPKMTEIGEGIIPSEKTMMKVRRMGG